MLPGPEAEPPPAAVASGPQRVCGIDARRAPRRNPAREDHGEDKKTDDRCQREFVGRRHAVEHRSEDAGRRQGAEQSNDSTNESESYALPDDELHDTASCSAECDADANFAGAL